MKQLSKEITEVIARAKVNQEAQGIMLKNNSLSDVDVENDVDDDVWQVVRCRGGIIGVGCGKKFALAYAKFRGSSLICPHCETEN